MHKPIADYWVSYHAYILANSYQFREYLSIFAFIYRLQIYRIRGSDGLISGTEELKCDKDRGWWSRMAYSEEETLENADANINVKCVAKGASF